MPAHVARVRGTRALPQRSALAHAVGKRLRHGQPPSFPRKARTLALLVLIVVIARATSSTGGQDNVTHMQLGLVRQGLAAIAPPAVESGGQPLPACVTASLPGGWADDGAITSATDGDPIC